MNTPSHVILNIALLIQPQHPQLTVAIASGAAQSAIAFGAVLPDIPMFALYFWAKFIRRLPERQIWSETYWLPFWQNITDTFHSIPIAALGLVIAHNWAWHGLEITCLSAILHSVLDLPVHNDDAHKHFLPLSNYRFISPISYWNPKKHGLVVTLVERGLVLIATFYVFPLLKTWFSQVLLVVVNIFYLTGYFYFYIFQRRFVKNCVNDMEV